MASRKSFFPSKPSYMYLTSEFNNPSTTTDNFELDEADLWSSFSEINLEEKKQQLPTSRSSKKHTRGGDWSGGRVEAAAASSVPVNVPDWSKILKGEYRDHKNRDSDDDGDADDGDEDHDGRVPPHEFLAQRRGASFSVHEGIGRTLKGRDLSRVRNAIWKKTGFED